MRPSRRKSKSIIGGLAKKPQIHYKRYRSADRSKLDRSGDSPESLPSTAEPAINVESPMLADETPPADLTVAEETGAQETGAQEGAAEAAAANETATQHTTDPARAALAAELLGRMSSGGTSGSDLVTDQEPVAESGAAENTEALSAPVEDSIEESETETAEVEIEEVQEAAPDSSEPEYTEPEVVELESMAQLFAEIDVRSPGEELDNVYQKRRRLFVGQADGEDRERLDRAYALACDRLSRAEKGLTISRASELVPTPDAGSEESTDPEAAGSESSGSEVAASESTGANAAEGESC